MTGIDSGAARSVALAGEISGYPVERDSETGRVYTSATGERVFDQGKQRGLGLELWTAKSAAGTCWSRKSRRASRVCTACVRLDIVSFSTSTATRLT